jgi:ferredoxin
MKVIIDANRCIASGACVFAYSEAFDQDDDGIAILKEDSELREDYAEGAKAAAAACPAAAITIID